MESISNNTIVHKDQMEIINEKLNTLQTAAHPLELENLIKSYSCPPFHFPSGCDQFY